MYRLSAWYAWRGRKQKENERSLYLGACTAPNLDGWEGG